MDGDPRDIVELSTSPNVAGEPRPAARKQAFLSLYFACAHAYGRAYKQRDGSCYMGRCPKCGKTVDFPIGEGGTSRRMFEVSCE
jgi:hypothetical protein